MRVAIKTSSKSFCRLPDKPFFMVILERDSRLLLACFVIIELPKNQKKTFFVSKSNET